MKVSIDMSESDKIEIRGVVLSCRSSVERLIAQLKTDMEKVWPKPVKKRESR